VLLSDRDIKSEVAQGRVSLEPWDEAMVQPSSVDVRLDRYFRLLYQKKLCALLASLGNS
jgi:dCTP deaminase